MDLIKALTVLISFVVSCTLEMPLEMPLHGMLTHVEPPLNFQNFGIHPKKANNLFKHLVQPTEIPGLLPLHWTQSHEIQPQKTLFQAVPADNAHKNIVTVPKVASNNKLDIVQRKNEDEPLPLALNPEQQAILLMLELISTGGESGNTALLQNVTYAG